MDRQLRYALGFQYQRSKDVNLGASLVYADYGRAKTRNDTLAGDYERQDLLFLTFNLDWKGVPWRERGKLETR